MIRGLLVRFAAASMIFAALLGWTPGRAAVAGGDKDVALRLWYDQPAADSDDGWVSQSIPLGNGYMGINLFGGVRKDRLQITENSLVDAPKNWIGGLNNFAEIALEFDHATPTNYSRDLVLNDGMAHVQYDNDGIHYARDYFASYPDKVLVVRLRASKSGGLDFTVRPTIPYLTPYRKTKDDSRGKRGVVTAARDTITLSGTMDYYGLKYEGQIKVIPQGGEMAASNDTTGGGGSIRVRGATSAVILVAVGTNYPIANPQVFSVADRLGKLKGFADPHDKVSAYITAAAARSYDDLLARHRKDYAGLFGRVNFDLGAQPPAIPTDRLVTGARAGLSNLYLDELAFQFGRYLLISSSRKGALPPNLQGVWNVYQDPPWTAGYWHNVNLQMNYGLAFNTNLPELFDSYIDFYRAYLPAQRAQATQYLTRFHSVALAADRDNGWAMGNSMGPLEPSAKDAHSGFGTGPWTTMLFWDYYDFTRDPAILRGVAYPAMRGQANFLSRFVRDVDGKLLADPSSSPENANSLQTVGATFDQQMIFENFRDTLEAATILGLHDPIVTTLRAQLPRLDPIKIGDSGQIKEYREETTYGSIGDPRHRHISQLLGLYPGRLINATTPAWLDAAKVSLEGRGMVGGAGWAQAERLATWARTGDAEKAYAFYRYWMSHHAMFNLWNNLRDSVTTKLFQVDGNFGVTAGVGEMLLQSHEGPVVPLPALPAAWPKGSYRGLLARGGFEVSAEWSNRHADRLEIVSRAGGMLTLRYPAVGRATVSAVGGGAVAYRAVDADTIAFATRPGETYIVTAIPVAEPVAPVAGLRIVGDTRNAVRLDWTSGGGSVRYSVDRAIGDAPRYTEIAAGLPTPGFTDTTPEIGTAKHVRYRVTAVSPAGRRSPGTSIFRLQPAPQGVGAQAASPTASYALPGHADQDSAQAQATMPSGRTSRAPSPSRSRAFAAR